jgi:serine/threonine protein kinase
MLQVGDQINGKYILKGELGHGAFGVVWLADWVALGTLVALKFTLRDAIDPTIIKEARVWVKASGHQNVLSFYNAENYANYVVLASEYAPGGSLQEQLDTNKGKCPTIEHAIEIISGILDGLEYIHARGVVHRDLKPANILFKAKTPLLADFGISRLLESTIISRGEAGTPAYTAPEAFDGVRNEQTDIWSVGVIFYQLLAGCLPFPQQDLAALKKAIKTRDPDPLPAVPAPLRQIVDRALAKETSQRYRSATEMKDCLRNAIQMLSLETTPHPPIPKRRLYLYLSITSIALLLLLISFAVWKFFTPCCSSCFVKITKPGRGEIVSPSPTVIAETSCTGMKHYIVVKPSGINQLYLQGELVATSANSWQGTAQIGDTGASNGEEFTIKVLATKDERPIGPLRQERIPEDAIFSNEVVVELKK